MADRNRELEAEIAGAPDDLALYQVYADWLGDRGDPRGELIALSIALAKDPGDPEVIAKLKELHARHDAAWLGGLATEPEGLGLTWRYGFLDAVEIGNDHAEIDLAAIYVSARAALDASPVGPLVRSLTIGAFSDEDALADEGVISWTPVANAIAKYGVPRTLKELRFDRGNFWDISSTAVGSIEALYRHLGGLETLYLELGTMELGTIVLPSLRDFEVYTGGFNAGNMRSVLGATWPQLERLVLRFGNREDYGGTCTVEDVLPLFASSPEGLKHLGLANAGFTDALLVPLLLSRLLPRLATLDLSMGLLSDAGAAVILDNVGAFDHLAKLDISKTYVTPEVVKRLQTALPSVIADSMKRTTDRYRYCSIGE